MTIDERLESLANSIERLGQKTDERLGALAQSVELLAGMQQKAEKRLYRLDRLIRLIVVDHEARVLRLEGEDEDGEGEKGPDA